MADHFVSLNQGEDGLKSGDFTTGTSTTATDDIELRVLDGQGLTKLDLIRALDAFKRFVQDPKQMAAAGFDVSG